MKTVKTHPHTGQTLSPVGFRKNGSPIWPIVGASEDDSAGDEGANDDESQEGDSEESEDSADGDSEEIEGADELGDAGKKALDAMKAKWRAERDKRRELERAQAKDGDDSEADKKAEQAIARANERIIKSEVKAAAKGVLADAEDAYRFLDLDQFEVDDDGNVDEDEIAEAIQNLVTQKPYLAVQDGRRFRGSASSGAGNSTKPGQLTLNDLERMSTEEVVAARKAGRFDKVMGIR